MAHPDTSLPLEAATSCPDMLAVPVTVIGPQYCVPYPMDLTIVRTVLTLRDCSFTITDVNGNVVFTVKAMFKTLRDRLHLKDSAGNIIATIRRKIRTLHDRWQVFRGESIDPKDLIFSVKRTFIIQPIAAKLNVFLASNTEEETCDYRIKGTFLERSAKIYKGGTETLVAQLKKHRTVKNLLINKDTYTVTVFPNIDQAFILALIMILHELQEEDDD